MYRIKRVAGILKRLAVVSLPPAVEPDGHEREQCKPLLADLKLQSEKLDRENLSSDERHIDPIERRDRSSSNDNLLILERHHYSCFLCKVNKQIVNVPKKGREKAPPFGSAFFVFCYRDSWIRPRMSICTG